MRTAVDLILLFGSGMEKKRIRDKHPGYESLEKKRKQFLSFPCTLRNIPGETQTDSNPKHR
jgi:hypothetical protein